eukprot:707440-Pyramimonas_sp.AAC.1
MHCLRSFSHGGLDPSSAPLCAAVLPRTGGVADVLERANVLASSPKRPEKLATSVTDEDLGGTEDPQPAPLKGGPHVFRAEGIVGSHH